MKILNSYKWLASVTVVVLVAVMLSGCKREEFTETTTGDVNITEYLQQDPNQFSTLSKVLQITGSDNSLGGYGTYTLFAPTNEAFAKYLIESGKTSVDQLGVEELKDLVRFHLIRDTITTDKFTDGKLRTNTMYGQSILTGAQNINGVTTLTINRQATLVKGNIRAGNGIVHVIDRVLKPSRLTLAQAIEQNPNYSIFTQALKETGFYDSLNVLPVNAPDTNKRFQTVLAQSNAVFAAAGYSSYSALKNRFSKTGDPKSVTDSLHLFMAYHILPGLKYLPDIFNASSHVTLAPLDVITTKLVNQQILVNDDTFDGKYEPGALINRAASDNTTANGVLHDMAAHYAIKVRFPIPVYWEVTDQPEFKRLTGVYRVTNKSSPNYVTGDLQDVKWQTGSVSYRVAPEARQFYVYNNDYLFIAALRTAATANSFVEFKTPLLVKGRYKVWVCFIRRGGGKGVSVLFNGEPLSRVLNLTESLPAQVLVGNRWTYPAGTSPESLEALGKKIVFGGPSVPYYNNPAQTIEYYRDSYGLLAGTIDVQKTDRHNLRLQAVADGSGDVQIDMIHFIPENMDQLYPKFNPDGSVIQKPQ
ncbi:fasciclin domain-containing protein [Mucilaginibacter aquatilis]|uniref:Fasciclin domain-containing protein n=1 Tax=Mucilaginibacter aquatilis TaxID=1517760 RepID=A0A6I4IR12_9SPHI|nr:fasciclin domain-containing protein [Mucilaginibacter aquatilis]MVN91994.1 fasciclin domain-containing protein [Mucilaginibacter aquatilis]